MVFIAKLMKILELYYCPIRSVIIRVLAKMDGRAAGVRFVYHEYYYRPNWTSRNLITNKK